MLPPILLERYAAATQLAETGQIAEALVAYQNIFKEESAGQPLKGAVTGDFLALVELRKACCHQVLGDDEAANVIFEEMDRYLAGQLDMAGLYEFYLFHGNTLGRLGLIPAMEDRMARAMNIALEELDDTAKFRAVWLQVLHWAKHHELWSLLADHSQSAQGFGVQFQDMAMQWGAKAYQCYAERGLGNYEAARRTAEVMLAASQQFEENSAAVAEWETFLSSLP